MRLVGDIVGKPPAAPSTARYGRRFSQRTKMLHKTNPAGVAQLTYAPPPRDDVIAIRGEPHSPRSRSTKPRGPGVASRIAAAVLHRGPEWHTPTPAI